MDIQKEIVRNYLDDIVKYATGTEKAKARECFLSIPKQLAKDNKKFQYSVVKTILFYVQESIRNRFLY